MKHLTILLILAATSVNAGPSSPSSPHASPVSLTQTPLVMRLDKNEFRIAFGINGEHRAPGGCTGQIRYRVDWKTGDGVTRSEAKQVSFTISPEAARTIAVDRQYFDTAEGQHTTDIVKVSVDGITCKGAEHRDSFARAR
jgi:hypothetical protein